MSGRDLGRRLPLPGGGDEPAIETRMTHGADQRREVGVDIARRRPFAKIAVSAAKIADITAQNCQRDQPA